MPAAAYGEQMVCAVLLTQLLPKPGDVHVERARGGLVVAAQ